MEPRLSYKPTDKMADIISENPSLLQVMSRFGMKLGFGDSTVEQMCASQGVDAPTFIEILNFVSWNGRRSERESPLSLPTLLYFLRQAHIYFLDFSLPNIESRLESAIGCYDHQIARLIMKLFRDYTVLVRQHMMYEEREIFPFVERLIAGEKEPDFKMASFVKQHSQVSDTLGELKNLIIKYFPAKESSNLINSALYDIMVCEGELESHCRIEDSLFAPAVMKLEKRGEAESESGKQMRESLGRRELAVLAEVARGYTNKEIAERLFISIHTVITHRRNIAKKLNIHSTAGLTIYAIANNLIDIKEIKLPL